MIFQVEMDVSIPQHLPETDFKNLVEKERTFAQKLLRTGEWRHLWRKVGQYSNLSVFDVEDSDRLHEILTSLPLFPFMSIKTTPLCRHPTSIRDDDR